ncbi:MAG: hypothetical protein JKY62_09600 [Desulfocapsa sp.]|nr:hypothetical protein [Desulfocapsa sp.]
MPDRLAMDNGTGHHETMWHYLFEPEKDTVENPEPVVFSASGWPPLPKPCHHGLRQRPDRSPPCSAGSWTVLRTQWTC